MAKEKPIALDMSMDDAVRIALNTPPPAKKPLNKKSHRGQRPKKRGK